MHKLTTVADHFRFFQKNHELLDIKSATLSTKMSNYIIDKCSILPMEYNHKVQSSMYYSSTSPSIDIGAARVRVFQKGYSLVLSNQGKQFYIPSGKSVDYFNLTEEERFQDSVDEGHYFVLDTLYGILKILIQINPEYF
ncbi:hypothetical protein [Kluyvera cryocrescens]|uniref:hypothetical protein n=1 Tax=Kluyvera cryocrescens TaxID=580 RepID=UPI00248C0BF3|nr:hypothetical protein [Kluyvera cryocrescens]